MLLIKSYEQNLWFPIAYDISIDTQSLFVCLFFFFFFFFFIYDQFMQYLQGDEMLISVHFSFLKFLELLFAFHMTLCIVHGICEVQNREYTARHRNY